MVTAPKKGVHLTYVLPFQVNPDNLPGGSGYNLSTPPNRQGGWVIIPPSIWPAQYSAWAVYLPSPFILKLDAGRVKIEFLTIENGKNSEHNILVYAGTSPDGVPYVVPANTSKSVRISSWQAYVDFAPTQNPTTLLWGPGSVPGLDYIDASTEGGFTFGAATGA